MSAGVWPSLDDAATHERIVSVIEGSSELYVAASEETANVVLTSPSLLGPSSSPVVVLAQGDHVRAARTALQFQAAGIVAWPEEAALLEERLLDAASFLGSDGSGIVISVEGARGGCGASTIVAHLARACGSRSMIIDLNGTGQILFAKSSQRLSQILVSDPSAESIRRLAVPHSSGALCVFGSSVEVSESFVRCIRGLAPRVFVDGKVPHADHTIVVLGRDRASLLQAGDLTSARVVLNGAIPGSVRARQVRKELGTAPFVIPRDRWLARCAERGVVTSRGPAHRAIAKLARSLA